ncbi:hypothetical protein R3W88_012489 [Solanum pinnatisectum]|uniref:Pectinesterase inhibitor domain-containing protein n=1 Tax=Solanum pinnatisectum TaxID=50273 RepID=A0AAV9L977_9SOLN|nr:hypothetical protein R3W88_012489 [Solanum pinnatisectum]
MAAAATSKHLEFALAILQSAKKRSPQAIEAYALCKTYWDEVASGLEGNLKVIKKDKGYASDTSDYDLKVTLDNATSCVTGLANAQVQDLEIAKGLNNTQMAVGAADTILEGLKPPRKLN